MLIICSAHLIQPLLKCPRYVRFLMLILTDGLVNKSCLRLSCYCYMQGKCTSFGQSIRFLNVRSKLSPTKLFLIESFLVKTTAIVFYFFYQIERIIYLLPGSSYRNFSQQVNACCFPCMPQKKHNFRVCIRNVWAIS